MSADKLQGFSPCLHEIRVLGGGVGVKASMVDNDEGLYVTLMDAEKAIRKASAPPYKNALRTIYQAFAHRDSIWRNPAAAKFMAKQIEIAGLDPRELLEDK